MRRLLVVSRIFLRLFLYFFMAIKVTLSWHDPSRCEHEIQLASIYAPVLAHLTNTALATIGSNLFDHLIFSRLKTNDLKTKFSDIDFSIEWRNPKWYRYLMGLKLKYEFIRVFAQLCIVKVRILVQSWKLPRAEAVAEWRYCVHNGARLHFYAFAYSRCYLILLMLWYF